MQLPKWDPAIYDAWYASDRGAWIGSVEYQAVICALGVSPVAGVQAANRGGSLLDIGCGTGWFTRQLAADGRFQVAAVDIDSAALAYARSQDSQSFYVQADFLSLPFADFSFDYVVSITALCFVTDIKRAIAELLRVTRKRFVIVLFNKHSLLWYQKGRRGGAESYQNAIWLTPSQLRAAFTGLPVTRLRLSSAIYLPGASGLGRFVEPRLPTALLLGGVLVLSGNISGQ